MILYVWLLVFGTKCCFDIEKRNYKKLKEMLWQQNNKFGYKKKQADIGCCVQSL